MTHLFLGHVGGGVPDRQDAALLSRIAALVEADAEVAGQVGALADPVPHVLLLLLWVLEGHVVGEYSFLVPLCQPGDDQCYLETATSTVN